MNILIGLLSGIVFFLCLLVVYVLIVNAELKNDNRFLKTNQDINNDSIRGLMESRVDIYTTLSRQQMELFQLSNRIDDLTQKKVKEDEITDKEKQELKKQNEGFKNVMNYDIDVALGRRNNGR